MNWSIVRVITGRRGVSSERRRSSCSSLYSFEESLATIYKLNWQFFLLWTFRQRDVQPRLFQWIASLLTWAMACCLLSYIMKPTLIFLSVKPCRMLFNRICQNRDDFIHEKFSWFNHVEGYSIKFCSNWNNLLNKIHVILSLQNIHEVFIFNVMSFHGGSQGWVNLQKSHQMIGIQITVLPRTSDEIGCWRTF